MYYDVQLIFQIAGIGIVVAMIHTILKQMGKEDIANWVTLLAFVIVLIMVASAIEELFQTIKSVFLFK
ncbi:stage III sporulation protein AC [Paenalkalicoccus suaedae]|uniref:Stage III sporulation protein AC n=1 Tax=Paenalkalicoccus suaedae TaxID=2592382 RepID=A0A859FEE8_9BACI|nr:stage III sporulation protein AC [Paenalkalicoccus suaedae]QKS70954.1 stage III sporulation protein AC [Paenalkalicoccus suaedae]